jgi:nucleotidyltransferase/DNA polymerase involved in DNA repair
MTINPQSNDLTTLMNVGEATLKDFNLLGITSIQELAHCSPDELFTRLQKITASPHDPCVWDIFASTINEAKTGEKTAWWKWSPIRKKRQKKDLFSEK